MQPAVVPRQAAQPFATRGPQRRLTRAHSAGGPDARRTWSALPVRPTGVPPRASRRGILLRRPRSHASVTFSSFPGCWELGTSRSSPWQVAEWDRGNEDQDFQALRAEGTDAVHAVNDLRFRGRRGKRPGVTRHRRLVRERRVDQLLVDENDTRGCENLRRTVEPAVPRSKRSHATRRSLRVTLFPATGNVVTSRQEPRGSPRRGARDRTVDDALFDDNRNELWMKRSVRSRSNGALIESTLRPPPPGSRTTSRVEQRRRGLTRGRRTSTRYVRTTLAPGRCTAS